jgi:hypothetical protein
VPAELARVLGQFAKDRLRGVLREERVAAQLAERDGINQVNVPLNKLGEGTFGLPIGKFLQ